MGYSTGLLVPKHLRKKPVALMQAIARANPDAVVFEEYQPCERLVLYGWGGTVQQRAIAQHRGHYAALDLGYWARDGFLNRHWRVALNGFHSPQYIMRGPQPSPQRWLATGLTAKRDKRHKGPILLIGNAPKSLRVIGANWSVNKLAEIRAQFPDRKVLYRPKPGRPIEPGVYCDGISDGSIIDALARCSLVVTRHSNVAVDACIRGVPVVCDDGAAAAIYPQSLSKYLNQPSHALRVQFLRRLAWWQWSIVEIKNGKFWPWLNEKFAEI